MRWPATLLLVLAFTALLRVPTLSEPYWYGDEGIFAAVAAQMNRGAKIYAETFDNKPPLIYLIYAIPFALFGTSLFSVKAAALGSVLVAQTFVYTIGRMFSKRAALIAALLLGLSASVPTFEGNLALTETFMLPFTTAAFFIALYRPKMLLWAGFLLSLAFLLKPIAGVEFAALFLFVFCIYQSTIRQKVGFVTGFLLLPLALAVYFALQGTFADFFFASILFYTGYLQWTPQASQTAFDLFVKLGVPTLAALALWIANSRGLFRIPQQPGIILLVLWLLSSWTAALFSGRPYAHYIIEALPATALAVSLIPVLLIQKKLAVGLLLSSGLLFMLTQGAAVFPVLHPTAGLYHSLAYYQNFFDFASGKRAAVTYMDTFDRTAVRNVALATWITQHVQPQEYVYIWGDAPWVYALAPIRNPSRYVVSFHVLEIRPGKQQVLSELASHPPRYIAGISDFRSFTELQVWMANRYQQRHEVAGIPIWERR